MAEGSTPRLTCQDVIGLLVDYLEATLTEETVSAFERHLQICPPCVAYLRTYRKTRELAATSVRAEMPDEVKARLRDLLLEQLARKGET